MHKTVKAICKVKHPNSPIKHILLTMDVEFRKDATKKEVAHTLETLPDSFAMINMHTSGLEFKILDDGKAAKSKPTAGKSKRNIEETIDFMKKRGKLK